MIVGDTVDIVGMIKKFLESEWYETMLEHNGKDVLDFLKKTDDKPD